MFLRIALLGMAFLAFQPDEIPPVEFAPEPIQLKEVPNVKFAEEKGEFVGTKGELTLTFRANRDLLKEESPTYVHWYKDGELHRDGGPAIESRQSREARPHVQKWYRNGKLHREDGPAVIYPSFEVWYKDGECLGSKERI